MTKTSYSKAFFISFALYSILGFIVFILLQQTTNLQEKINKPIKICIITPIKPVAITKPQPVISKTVTPTPIIKKPEPKPIIKKTPPKIKPKPKKIIKKKKVIKKKPKKIVHKKVIHKKKVHKKKVHKKIHKKKRIIKKRKPVHKKIIKKRVVKKQPSTLIDDSYTYTSSLVDDTPIIKEVFREPTPVVKKYVAPKPIVAPPPPPKVDKSRAIAQFKSHLRNTINSHKRYPKMARRRHIEGSVTVKFDITAHGNVSNIRFIRGKRILQKGARKAVLASFPQSIPSDIRDHFPMNSVVLTMHFNLD